MAGLPFLDLTPPPPADERKAPFAHSEWLAVVGLALLGALIISAFQFYQYDPIQEVSVTWGYHIGVMNGTTQAPWVYRVFTEWLFNLVNMGLVLAGVPLASAVTVIGLRYLQNTAILALAAVLYRRLDVNMAGVVIGMTLITWAMITLEVQTLNTYTDVIFYLLGGLLILSRRWWGLVPLMLAASLNRDTSGFIPLMLAVSTVSISLKPLRVSLPARAFWAGIASAGAYTAAFLLMRLTRDSGYLAPYGVAPGADLIAWNIFRLESYQLFLPAIGLTLAAALMGLNRVSGTLHGWFWLLVPLWFFVHFAVGVIAEARLFLVPVIVALIPVMLVAVGRSENPDPLVARPWPGLVLIAVSLLLTAGWVDQLGQAYPWEAQPWQATFYRSEEPGGLPWYAGQAGSVDVLDWGSYPYPWPRWQTDQPFSARWVRRDQFEEGTYIFAANSPAGVRVYLDEVLVLDRGSEGGVDWVNEPVNVSAGIHRITVELRSDGTGPPPTVQAGYYPAP